MKIIGLTGGIASGKSTAARVLEHYKAVVIDADAVAHQVMSPNGSAYNEVLHNFGQAILDSAGNIDRQKLGNLVFSNPNALQKLNHLVHPHVRHAMRQQLNELEQSGNTRPVFLMIPLLYESDLTNWVESIWVVYCTPEQQLSRLQTRNGLSEAESKARLAAQWSIDIKRERADLVLDNTGAPGTLEKQIAEAMKGELS